MKKQIWRIHSIFCPVGPLPFFGALVKIFKAFCMKTLMSATEDTNLLKHWLMGEKPAIECVLL